MRATGEAIAALQLSDGSIPWELGRHADPWNHTEAAMGLDVAGLHSEAERAYGWLADIQRPDGSWCAAYLDGEEMDLTVDSNFCAYIAAGVWHHYLATDDEDFLKRLWPTVEAAIDMVLRLQRPDGSIAWAQDERGIPWPGALLTSSSCIYLSVRSAMKIAAVLQKDRPDWKPAAFRLARAVSSDPAAFESRDRYSMDWYYPVLSGALRRGPAVRRLRGSWHRFVVNGWGSLCVVDRPWVTTGETAELVLACTTAGMRREAERLWEGLASLRDDNDLYWTGRIHPTGVRWPHEKTTWSAGSVLLAFDALFGDGPTSRFFEWDDLT
jgi:hypothetical protein